MVTKASFLAPCSSTWVTNHCFLKKCLLMPIQQVFLDPESCGKCVLFPLPIVAPLSGLHVALWPLSCGALLFPNQPLCSAPMSPNCPCWLCPRRQRWLIFSMAFLRTPHSWGHGWHWVRMLWSAALGSRMLSLHPQLCCGEDVWASRWSLSAPGVCLCSEDRSS